MPSSCTPLCELYSVDMAFCGGEGLVTSKDAATFIMVCQQVGCCASHGILWIYIERFPDVL